MTLEEARRAAMAQWSDKVCHATGVQYEIELRKWRELVDLAQFLKKSPTQQLCEVAQQLNKE